MALAGFFKKKRVEEAIHAPADGQVIAIDAVPDEVFAGRMLGDGFAVEPTDGVFRAPVSGEIVVLAATHHAFAVRTQSGLEVLVHIGIDTVALGADSFTAKRKQGDMVEVGDEVIVCDLEAVAARVPSMATSVVVTNGQEFSIASIDLDAAAHDPVATVTAT